MEGEHEDLEWLQLHTLFMAANEGTPGSTVDSIAGTSGAPLREVRRVVRQLVHRGFLKAHDGAVTLTPHGVDTARMLGFLPDQIAELMHTPGATEPSAGDPTQYLPSAFQPGGDDWLGSAADGESPS